MSEQEIRLPGGMKHWFDPDKKGEPRSNVTISEPCVSTPAGELYRVPKRVVGGGVVLAGARKLVPIAQAREWAEAGYLDDPSLLDPREDAKPHDPREDVKEADTPDAGDAQSATGDTPADDPQADAGDTPDTPDAGEAGAGEGEDASVTEFVDPDTL